MSAILFDEPLTVIDPQLKWKLRRKLKEIHHRFRITFDSARQMLRGNSPAGFGGNQVTSRIAAVEALDEVPEVVWAAGEAASVQRLRKHLFDVRGMSRSEVTARGYWKRGRSAT